MSRKRDTNWSRDEITTLLDSIVEITKTRAGEGKRTNSKEVFEFAAKKMGEKGHTSRADKEKCRTKWKKMKEEFTQAKRARDGDARYKEAPGILPFLDRMEEFINGKFDNISPHSTIVRRTSSLSVRSPAGMRISARIAASSNGTSSSDITDTSSTTIIKTNSGTDYPSTIDSSSVHANPSSRQNSGLSSSNNSSNNSSTNFTAPITVPALSSIGRPSNQMIADVDLYQASFNNNPSDTTETVNNNGDLTNILATEHADISYRVTSGCRQITIFGDHDVDIKFRGDCVTINKIDVDHAPNES